MHGSHYEFLLFAGDNRFRATAETVIAAITDFYEYNTVFVLHHQIYFATPAFVVFFDQFKTIGSQIAACGFLRQFTKRDTGDAVISHYS